MSRYVWIGKSAKGEGFSPDGHGTAYRPRTFDGRKAKDAGYVFFDAVLKDIHRKTRLAMQERGPIKPRMSRKGKPLSGILPRLCGY
jgi:hypothetical protein